MPLPLVTANYIPPFPSLRTNDSDYLLNVLLPKTAEAYNSCVKEADRRLKSANDIITEANSSANP